MVVDQAMSEQIVLPVSVRVGDVVGHAVFVQPVRIFRLLAPEVDRALCKVIRLADVFKRLVDPCHVVGIIGDLVDQVSRLRIRDTSGIGNRQFTSLTLFCRDQDNTIGCT